MISFCLGMYIVCVYVYYLSLNLRYEKGFLHGGKISFVFLVLRR